MNIREVETQMNELRSMISAFPSNASSIGMEFSTRNTMATIDLQVQSTKLLMSQAEQLQKASQVLGGLLRQAELREVADRERAAIEDARFRENTRLARIAAWAGVISVGLAALGVIFQIALK